MFVIFKSDYKSYGSYSVRPEESYDENPRAHKLLEEYARELGLEVFKGNRELWDNRNLNVVVFSHRKTDAEALVEMLMWRFR